MAAYFGVSLDHLLVKGFKLEVCEHELWIKTYYLNINVTILLLLLLLIAIEFSLGGSSPYTSNK
jgi:hypothetical protein